MRPVRPHWPARLALNTEERDVSLAAVDLCQEEIIELRDSPNRLRKLSGLRYQEFSVHKWNHDELFEPWRLSHLPTGTLLAKFSKKEDACAAMIEIAKLRNDWAILREGDVGQELKQKCLLIVVRHCGEISHGHNGHWSMRYDLNGYSGTLTD